jgi:hypothetical protein
MNKTNPRNVATGTEAFVCADIVERQAKGVAKYGTTVAQNPLTLRQWLQHAYEECLDQAVYLRRAIDESDAPRFTARPNNPQTQSSKPDNDEA